MAARHIDVGEAHFWVLGAGGLGCPALLGLIGAGARRITIVDHDTVEAHNLQRQVLYSTADVGAAKAEVAARAVRARAPGIVVATIVEAMDPDQLTVAIGHAGPGTVVLECSDAPALKFAANDAGLTHRVPVVIAAAIGWRGQAIAVHPAHACYRCVYEAPPAPDAVPTCAQAGVIGTGVGFLGFLAAHLAVSGVAAPQAAGMLHDVDLLRGTTRALAPNIRPDCPAPHQPE